MTEAPQLIEIAVEASPGHTYSILFGSRSELPATLRAHNVEASRCLVVTDDNVAELYGAEMERSLQSAGFDVSTYIVRPGEPSKDLEVVANLYRWSFANGIDRHTPVVALGGGVVGDLTGFFAATVLRGVPLVHVPTTLVAQVDSSIGGKTGVNHLSGKNLIGAFYRPVFSLVDTSYLDSLRDQEWRNGLSEVLKHALIRDAGFYEWLRDRWASVIGRESSLVGELVQRGAAIKIDVVQADEMEAGLRRILNLGHTFGHAMERIAGYGTLDHGAAVALGMRAALKLSADRGRDLPVAEVDALLSDLKPVTTPRMPVDWLLQSMRRDKKRVGDTLHVVLLRSIGEADVVSDASDEELRAALEFALT